MLLGQVNTFIPVAPSWEATDEISEDSVYLHDSPLLPECKAIFGSPNGGRCSKKMTTIWAMLRVLNTKFNIREASLLGRELGKGDLEDV